MHMKGLTMPLPSADTQHVTDIQFAAYLMAKRVPLVRVEPGARTVFIFHCPQSEVLAYYSDDTLIAPRLLLDALRNLKSLVQGGRR
jgi:hypothetical protein